jgi:hypothetical protein
MKEQRVCALHGGKTPGALKVAEERTLKKRAAALVVAWEGKIEDDPMVQLRRMVRVAAMAERAYAMLMESELKDGILTTVGSETAGYRQEPHAYLKLWNEERDRLANISAKAISAGLAEREAQLQEAEAKIAIQLFEGAMETAGLAAEIRVQLRLAIGQQAQKLSLTS